MTWLLPILLCVAPAPALQYRVTLFDVEVGEIAIRESGDRLRVSASSSGALLVFFPAAEEIDVWRKQGRPVRIRRRYDHAGVVGTWEAKLSRDSISIRHRRGKKLRTKEVRLPQGKSILDPASALLRLKDLAGSKDLSLAVFGVDGIYQLEAKQISSSPLRYRGTFRRILGRKRRKRATPRTPFWLKMLGLGRGATKRPTFEVWYGARARTPTRIRLSDHRGRIELQLKGPPRR